MNLTVLMQQVWDEAFVHSDQQPSEVGVVNLNS